MYLGINITNIDRKFTCQIVFRDGNLFTIITSTTWDKEAHSLITKIHFPIIANNESEHFSLMKRIPFHFIQQYQGGSARRNAYQ